MRVTEQARGHGRARLDVERVAAEGGDVQQVELLHRRGRRVVDEDGKADVVTDDPQVLLAVGVDGLPLADVVSAPVRVRVRVGRLLESSPSGGGAHLAA